MLFKVKSVAFVASYISVTMAGPVPAVDAALGKHMLANGRIVEDLPEGPLEIPANVSATRRDLDSRGSNEMLYFVNCYGDATKSEMNYYANGRTGSQNQQQPDSVATVSSGYVVTWEGASYTASFNGGGSATSYIQSYGASTNYAWAGYAYNSYGQYFDCYKDDGHQLHVGANDPNYHCYSVYYCFDG